MWSFTVGNTGKGINEINYNKFIWEKEIKFLINFIVELIKVWSCVDAVFKLLHVVVARKATDRKKKKNFWTVLQFLNTNRMGFVEF